MSGILRNSSKGGEAHAEFDRSEVLKNTERNAQLVSEGQRIRDQLREHHARSVRPDDEDEPTKKVFPKTKFPGAKQLNAENVEFDENEIKDWDTHRGQAQKILEPNTPYMGTAADTEYYDEDPVPEDLDLGKSA